MKAYLVGGAVRDECLNLPIGERDWVVIGETPSSMQKAGFKQVGKAFPVFLHPKTQEEYALARKERKTGPGYYGFQCDFSPEVSLEEDLERRDLTINAMAKDETRALIDPYGGLNDLKQKILRHVSSAFIEDPVRVLRVARFAARFYHLGFTLAEETRQLMYRMVRSGELAHLIAERVWQEWEGSLTEKNPEIFILTLRSCGALNILFPEIDALFGIPNKRQYHPEVDSGIHTILSLQVAASLTQDPLVRFGTLMHDLGKARSPMTEWPAHHAHDARGIEPIQALCNRFRVPLQYQQLALLSAEIHLLIHDVEKLKPQTIVKVFQKVDAFRRPDRFKQILQICEADYKGRLGKNEPYRQTDKWKTYLQECDKISVADLVKAGFSGERIKNVLHDRRINCIKNLRHHETQ